MSVQFSCENCQKPFLAHTYDIKLRQLGLKHSLTCSRECAFAIRRGRQVLKRQKRVDLKCERCGKPFQEKLSYAAERRFCSVQCKAEHQKTSMLGERNHFFGRKHSEQSREKISENHWRGYGPENPLWRGGKELKRMIRDSPKYAEWRSNIFKRDQFSSTLSGKRGGARELVAHHKKPFSEILREFLALHSDLDTETDKVELFELALNYQPFWDVSNGMTLLRDEHFALHSRQDDSDDND